VPPQRAAEAIGIGRSTLASIESGHDSPGLAALQAIAKFYGVSTDALIFGGEGDEAGHSIAALKTAPRPRRSISRLSQRLCAQSQTACIIPSRQSQLVCVENSSRLCVGPFIIARR
jgi:transcriptional regulator with XRE-family HTH domain